VVHGTKNQLNGDANEHNQTNDLMSGIIVLRLEEDKVSDGTLRFEARTYSVVFHRDVDASS
jgi:hypothetical protein